VPFHEKNEAKELGARWDKTKRQWYAPAGESELIDRWGTDARQLEVLVGEDRTFGNDRTDKLYVDFFPKTCPYKKLEYTIRREDVRRVEDLVMGRVNRTCEACGTQDVDKPFKMHGRWSSDEMTCTQKLERIVALCNDCYEVTHFGTANYHGRRANAEAHWCQVTGRTSTECKLHIDNAYTQLAQLNGCDWTYDLSLLTANGLGVREPRTFEQFQNQRHTTNNNNNTNPQNTNIATSKVEHRDQSLGQGNASSSSRNFFISK